jgi:uncharacterized protein (TIGR03086 family)
MTVSADPVAVLSRALDQVAALIARVGPDQAQLPTPCKSWDLRTLVNHVVNDAQKFVVVARGGAWEARQEDLLGDDWLASFRRPADELVAAWNREGALDRTVQFGSAELPASWQVTQQIVELTIHAWDIATATGQQADLDPEPARVALAFGIENLKPQFRGREEDGQSFGPVVAVPDDAPIYDRLAGFFGRDPRWTAATAT